MLFCFILRQINVEVVWRGNYSPGWASTSPIPLPLFAKYLSGTGVSSLEIKTVLGISACVISMPDIRFDSTFALCVTE